MEEKKCKSANHLNLIGDLTGFLGIIVGFVYAGVTTASEDVVTFVIRFLIFAFSCFIIRAFAKAVADIAENSQKAISKEDPAEELAEEA